MNPRYKVFDKVYWIRSQSKTPEHCATCGHVIYDDEWVTTVQEGTVTGIQILEHYRLSSDSVFTNQIEYQIDEDYFLNIPQDSLYSTREDAQSALENKLADLLAD